MQPTQNAPEPMAWTTADGSKLICRSMYSSVPYVIAFQKTYDEPLLGLEELPEGAVPLIAAPESLDSVRYAAHVARARGHVARADELDAIVERETMRADPATRCALDRRLRAAFTELTTFGDLTPAGKRVLNNILDGE